MRTTPSGSMLRGISGATCNAAKLHSRASSCYGVVSLTTVGGAPAVHLSKLPGRERRLHLLDERSRRAQAGTD
ncbi:hypothetical protein SAMN05428944_0070 [Streptomyces sp. 1222.5]|nr:hypothetical protein BX260_0067 [Streptomyces sp. 5112.2]SEB53182.1 hypothetical protein SAMN05428944_0070 [Streptomyces sp. 1222.5]